MALRHLRALPRFRAFLEIDIPPTTLELSRALPHPWRYCSEGFGASERSGVGTLRETPAWWLAFAHATCARSTLQHLPWPLARGASRSARRRPRVNSQNRRSSRSMESRSEERRVGKEWRARGRRQRVEE